MSRTDTARRSAPPARLARVRAALRDVPAAAWACAAVALLNGVAWSLITPAFELPDEITHYAYVEHLAQTGRPPIDRTEGSPLTSVLSPDEQLAYDDLKLDRVPGRPGNGGVWSPLEQRRLVRDLHAGASRDTSGYSFGAAPQPPLYYALAAIPYRIASGGTLLARLALMRLLSALLGAVTVLCVYLFLREALPGVSWAWTVGALGAALQPLFGFVSGGVNPDALLFAAAAALFLCVARALRRGLDARLAAAIGVVMAVGLLGKLNFAGLLPGAAIALWLAAPGRGGAGSPSRASRPPRREPSAPRRSSRLPALAFAIALAPLALDMLLNVAVWDRAALGLVSGNAAAAAGGSIGGRLAYAWQLYLPHLPGMTRLFPPGYVPTWELWWKGFIASFGWLDTHFPGWAYRLAVVPFAAILALAARALVVGRASVRRRLPELAVYALMAAGMLALTAAQSSAIDHKFGTTGSGSQARYLLPLLPLYAGALALAARGAGRRWMPIAGTTIVLLALAHDLFAQLVTIGRFYA